MRTAAMTLMLLIDSMAVGVQPFSWDIQWQSVGLPGIGGVVDELEVPDGMAWVVEHAYGYASGDQFSFAEPGVVEVWKAGDGQPREQLVYLAPEPVLVPDINFDGAPSWRVLRWDFTQPLVARYTGDVEAAVIAAGPQIRLSLVGYLTPTLAGDYSGDGIVDAADYTVLRDNAALWEPSDMALFQTNYGRAGSSVSLSIPEPTAVALLGMHAVAIAGCRRRSVFLRCCPPTHAQAISGS